jgi:hypothetical protein
MFCCDCWLPWKLCLLGYCLDTELRKRYPGSDLVTCGSIPWKAPTILTKTLSITLKILEIIHRPVFYLKLDVMETGFCLRIQVEPVQMGPVNRANICFRTQATTSIVFIKLTQQKPPVRVNIFYTLNLHTHMGPNFYMYMHCFMDNVFKSKRCANVSFHSWFLLCSLYKHYWYCCWCQERD